MNKKICFIAQFPPPIHGLSKAVDILYNSNLQEEFEFEKINITNNKKIIKNLWTIYRSKADLFYFTISQTRGGNIRDLVILKLLEKQNKKCLIHLHGGHYRELVDNNMPKWQKKANYNAMSKVERVIVLGKSLKYIFKDMIDENKICIVPNCVDDEFLSTKEEFDDKLANIQSKEIKNVLYLSNFIKEKGYEYVLKLAELEKKYFYNTGKRTFHFNFAGKFFCTKEKKEFFEYIKRNKLEDFVTYYGVVDGEEKRKLLRKSDIFILLTKYAKEGQPISILEAMANGMVIITTDHAGIPDIVENEKNGVVIEKNKVDVQMIYNSVKSIDFKSILINNYNVVQHKYLKKNYISNVKSIFENLIKDI